MADREFNNINGIKVCDQTARDKIPTKTSQLTNDNNYATITQVNQAINNAQLSGGGTPGVGIQSIVTYYRASSSSSGVTKEANN